MCARAQGKAPARAAFAGKVSECVCVRALKAPARAAFTVAASPAAAFPARACACASNNLCAMTLPRAEVRDPPVLTAGVIRSPRSARLSSLEPRNYELYIRLKPVGFLLVEIHRRFINLTLSSAIETWQLKGKVRMHLSLVSAQPRNLFWHQQTCASQGHCTYPSSQWLKQGIFPGHLDWTCKKISQKHSSKL